MRKKLLIGVGVLFTVGGSFSRPAWPHCDTRQGPVATDVQKAIESRDITPVLKWVRQEDERVIRDVFAAVLSVRSKGRDAQKLADRYFVETAVRLHRASEGEPFTGLKEDNSNQTIIKEADNALASGSVDGFVSDVVAETEVELRKLFVTALQKMKSANENVQAGREYVAAYVALMHFLEKLGSDPEHETVGKSEANH